MRFTREKDFAPDRVWKSPDLSARDGVLLPVSHVLNFQSAQLMVTCSGRNSIRAKLNPKLKDFRLHLVEIVDNRGRPLEHLGGSFGDYEFDGLWKIPTGAESIKLTLGLAEMRHVEFIAQPVRQ